MPNLPSSLNNIYYGLRHGKSEANHLGVVVSTPEKGIEKCGLVEEGREAVKNSVMRALVGGKLDNKTILLHSPFLRTLETAQIAQEILGIKQITPENKLMERNFGDLEGESSMVYPDVYQLDIEDPYHSRWNVEPVMSVLHRTVALINDLEAQHTGKKFLLVAHGDTLQILQTAFAGISPQYHRTLTHLSPGELREFHLKS